MFMRVGGRLYGYRSRCPGCEQPLTEAKLRQAELVCGGCGNRFDVLRAGRCLDQPQLHLEPVPLLEGEDGLVRIAVPIAA
jgi:nitrite reductase/ring-hydroxylating ferredoxin subunit